MTKIDLEKCRICEESRCILSTYYKMNSKDIKEVKELKKFQEYERIQYNKKIKEYYIKETKSWTQFKNREAKLVNYNRKPYMNESDWRHDNNWFLGITKLMELQKQYYSNIKY